MLAAHSPNATRESDAVKDAFRRHSAEIIEKHRSAAIRELLSLDLQRFARRTTRAGDAGDKNVCCARVMRRSNESETQTKQ
jgi:hypothetical protein